MYFFLGICKRGRRCGSCTRPIPKGEKFFETSEWTDDRAYPKKSNLCLLCAEKLSDKDFIIYLRKLLRKLVEMNELVAKQPKPEVTQNDSKELAF